MKSIEKSLANFLNGTIPQVDEEDLINYASKSEENANDVIDTLFRVINNNLTSYSGEKSLKKIRTLLKLVSTIMLNSEGVDRGIVNRKVRQLDYRLEHLMESNKKKILDGKTAADEIEKTQTIVSNISDQCFTTETSSYDIVNNLIVNVKNVNYIESVFNKMPSLVNTKDSLGNCLLQNVIIKYQDSVEAKNEQDIFYFKNIISLIVSHKGFYLSDKQKRKVIDTVHSMINKMSCKKKKMKLNRPYIEFLDNLIDSFQSNTKRKDIDELSKIHNISISFEPNIINQVSCIKTKQGNMTGREVVDDYTITIDNDGAIEIDDALTCRKLDNGNYLLGVHIASVLGYFSYDSFIVQEAINRYKSIYLPKKYQNKSEDYEKVIPIFPYEFSAKLASLLPGENRLARSYFFEIDSNGNIVKEKFKKTIVKSDLQATYNQIDDVLRNGSSNKKLEILVKNLNEVTNILDKKYKVSDIYECIKENNEDFSDMIVKNSGSQGIINKAMLLTGNRVGCFFAEHNYPCVYRVHEVNENNIIKIRAVIDSFNKNYKDQKEQLYSLLNGIYPKGWYGIEGSHYGLGLEHYCHCTSELRRAPDIVVEHALEVCYDRQPTKEDIANLQNEINSVVIKFNSKQNAMDWFIRDYKKEYQKRRH